MNSPHTLPTTARAPRASVHRVDPAQGKTTSHGDHTLLPFLYAMDQEHGWSQGMRAITHVLLAATGQKRGPLLELGCGSGVFLQEVIEHDPHQMGIGIDRSSIALEHADQRHAPLQLAQADLQQLPFAANHFGLIVALDSFDQQAVKLSVALQESWRILQPHGLLLLRVSAHPWLRGAHDAAFNTGRRYQRQELLTALHANAFQVERVTYANSLLALPVILQRFLQRWHLLSFAGHDTLSPVIHQQVAQLLRWEANLLRTINLPFGISLYVLARKRP